MDDAAKQIIDQVVGQVFGYQNPFTLDQFRQKFAFDVRLPSQVSDSTTGQTTWASSINPQKFMTMENARKRVEVDDFMPKPRALNNIQDILAAWDEINFTSTERQIDSTKVDGSDCVYNSEDVYYSQDIRRSKHVVFSDSSEDCEYIVASQRSNTSTYCIKLDDSKECSKSFQVSWSAKVTNSMFIHDCYDVYECLFCSHISSKKFCIANMQFSEDDYNRLKPMVVQWVLTQ